MINIALILRFLAAGFASAVIASKWKEEPWPCIDFESGIDFCDIVLLITTNALQCVSIYTLLCA